MARRMTTKRWASGAGYAALAAFATLASGFPQVGSGPFTLASGADVDIYPAAPPPPAPLAGVTVNVQSGAVRVRVNNAGTFGPLGQVGTGQTGVFEGPFAGVNLIANVGMPAPASNGTYVVRAPTDGTDPDRLVGAGRLILGSGYQDVTAYGSFDAAGASSDRVRLLAVDLRGTPQQGATVTSSNAAGTAGPSYVIDGGDWGFCSRSISKFTVHGNGPVPFSVYAPTAGCSAISGVARAQTANDVDSLDVDGQANLRVVLTNNGTGNVTLTYAIGGVLQPPMTIAPGPAQPIAGLLTRFEWTYANLGCTVSLAITGN